MQHPPSRALALSLLLAAALPALAQMPEETPVEEVPVAGDDLYFDACLIKSIEDFANVLLWRIIECHQTKKPEWKLLLLRRKDHAGK